MDNVTALGEAFITHYYTTFDTQRAQIGHLYVREPPPQGPAFEPLTGMGDGVGSGGFSNRRRR